MNCSQCFELLPDDHSGPCPRCGHNNNVASVANPTAPEIDFKVVNEHLTNANLCRIRAQYSEAIEHCVAALKVDSQNHTAHSLLGDIYRDQGRLEDSAQWYRMAVDIHPNPVDQSRLTAVEKAIEKLAAAVPDDNAQNAPSQEWGGGTTNLMGVKPQKWLSLITAVSGIFLVITLVILLRQPKAKAPHIVSGPAATAASTNTPAPTLQLPPQPVPPAVSSTGGGLPADQPSGGTIEPRTSVQTAPSSIPQPQQFVQKPGSQSGPKTAPVLPAMPGVPQGQITNAPTDNSTPVLPTSPLTGSMQISNMQNTGNGVVAVMVSAPTNWSTAGGKQAETTIMRNILRAARNALGTNPDYTLAHVFVEVQYGTNQLSIADAQISRENAYSTNPDTASYSALQSALVSFHWANSRSISAGIAAGSAPQVSSGN